MQVLGREWASVQLLEDSKVRNCSRDPGRLGRVREGSMETEDQIFSWRKLKGDGSGARDSSQWGVLVVKVVQVKKINKARLCDRSTNEMTVELTLHVSNAGGMGSIPAKVTKILHNV